MGNVVVIPDRSGERTDRAVERFMNAWLDDRAQIESKRNQELTRAYNAAINQLKAYDGDPEKQSAIIRTLRPELREYFTDPSTLPVTDNDRLRSAVTKANLDAVTTPYATQPPVDPSGNISYDAMHTRMGAGMSPEPMNSVETFRRLNTAYNLQTGDNPNETTSKGFQSFALQGEPGWLEQNRIAGGQLPDANQLTRTSEDRRQFETRWPFEQRKVESEIGENNASAFASRELGTNRSQERVIGSDYNEADIDVRRRSGEPARGGVVKDGQFNYLRNQMDSLVDARNKLIAAGKPTDGVDRQIGVVRRDLQQRGFAIGVDVYGQSLSGGQTHAPAGPNTPGGRPAGVVQVPARPGNPPSVQRGSGTAPQTYGGNAEFVIESVMKKFGYSRDEAIANLKARGYL